MFKQECTVYVHIPYQYLPNNFDIWTFREKSHRQGKHAESL